MAEPNLLVQVSAASPSRVNVSAEGSGTEEIVIEPFANASNT